MAPKKNQARKAKAKAKASKRQAKKVEMIRMSEGTTDCQAITPVFHTAAPYTMNSNRFFSIPKNVYYQQTSKKSSIGETGPQLSSRITGNSIYSKYLNYRYRIQFPHSPGNDNGNVQRYRILAGTFQEPPLSTNPWQGWISDQNGTPTSPDLCDSDFAGNDWSDVMKAELRAFYTGAQIWGGLLEKARWNLILDRTVKSTPITSTQLMSGNTPAWTGGSDIPSGAPGLVAGHVQSTRS
jgi:hypothetical protein